MITEPPYGRVMPPVFVSRLGGLAGTIALLIMAALPASAGPLPLAVEYSAAVYGDFAVTGNTVTTCPPVRACVDAQHRVGVGPSAQNNGHLMTWVDVDGDASTFNSSSGAVLIPAGARIVHAKLGWAGAAGGCGAVTPPSSPRKQAVAVTALGRTSRVLPDRYTEDGDHLFYGARADLTSLLHGAGGEVTITVGNVWTPKGFGCFGGWSVLVVWAFDHPQAPFAMARKQITVYDTHIRVVPGVFGLAVVAPSLRAAGGASRIGVTAYEGDWALAGDRLVVNGHDPDGTGNFFVSAAEDSQNPNYPNNMSVDVRTFEVPDSALKAGDTRAELRLSSGLDDFLLQSVAVASPMPELLATTSVDHATVHAGDEVTQTVRVTNVGGAPAVRLRLRGDLGCDREVPRLDAGDEAEVNCTRAVSEVDSRPTARVDGQSLIGDPLSASADTSIAVLAPALTASVAVTPDVVLKGQSVSYRISMRNTGNTPLSGVAVEGACDSKDTGTLAAGQIRIVACTIVAADKGFNNTIAVSGTDKLGRRASARADATVRVVDPRVTMTVVPSTHAVRPGESVTLTITVTNPTIVHMDDVAVSGTPATCVRRIGTLGAGQSVSYTCAVVVTDRLTTALSVTATPVLGGTAAESSTVRGSGVAIVSVVPAIPPPLPPPPLERAALVLPLQAPAPVAALIAGLAVLSNFVTTGAIAATACRRK